jgi:hypothetical protein
LHKNLVSITSHAWSYFYGRYSLHQPDVHAFSIFMVGAVSDLKTMVGQKIMADPKIIVHAKIVHAGHCVGATQI